MIRILFSGINPLSSHRQGSCLCCVCKVRSISLVSYWLHFSGNKLCLTWPTLCWGHCFQLHPSNYSRHNLNALHVSGRGEPSEAFFCQLFERFQEKELCSTEDLNHRQAGSTWWVEMGDTCPFTQPRNISWVCSTNSITGNILFVFLGAS